MTFMVTHFDLTRTKKKPDLLVTPRPNTRCTCASIATMVYTQCRLAPFVQTEPINPKRVVQDNIPEVAKGVQETMEP